MKERKERRMTAEAKGKSWSSLAASFALVVVAVIWGSGFIATDAVIAANWSTSLILVSRFSLAALLMALALRSKLKQSTILEIRGGIIAGVFLFVSFYLQTLGQGMTTVSNTAFYTATSVVMVPFISWPVNKSRPQLRTLLLALLALAGVGVLSYSGGQFSLGSGDLIVLLCAFFFASHTTYLEKAGKDTDAARVSFYQILTAAVISLSVFLINPALPNNFDFRAGLFPVFYLAAFSTGLCYFLQTRAQQFCSATVACVILSLEGFFGSFFSVIIGLEPMRFSLLIGGGLIIAASLLMNLLPTKRSED